MRLTIPLYTAQRWSIAAYKVALIVFGAAVAVDLVALDLWFYALVMVLLALVALRWNTTTANNVAYATITQHRALRSLRVPYQHKNEASHV